MQTISFRLTSESELRLEAEVVQLWHVRCRSRCGGGPRSGASESNGHGVVGRTETVLVGHVVHQHLVTVGVQVAVTAGTASVGTNRLLTRLSVDGLVAVNGTAVRRGDVHDVGWVDDRNE